jgi:hypothetical protein
MGILYIFTIPLFVISIIAFFIKNGFKRQTLLQIFGTGYNPVNPRFLLIANPPDGLLVLSVISFIIFITRQKVMNNIGLELLTGLSIILLQKILIFIIQRIAAIRN